MELKIKLKVKDVEIELTKDEAVELKDLLDKLCTQKTEYVPYYPQYPVQPTYPWSPWYTGTPWPGTTWIADNTAWVSDTISDNVQVSYSRGY